MSCPNCLNFGNVPHGQVIVLPMLSAQSGLHFIHFDIDNISRHIPVEIAAGGDPFSIDTSVLNENREICFSITDPSGQILSFTLNIDIDATPATADPTTAEIIYYNFKIKPILSMISGAAGAYVVTTEIVNNILEPRDISQV